MVSCEIIALPRIYEKSFVGNVVLAAVSRFVRLVAVGLIIIIAGNYFALEGGARNEMNFGML